MHILKHNAPQDAEDVQAHMPRFKPQDDAEDVEAHRHMAGDPAEEAKDDVEAHIRSRGPAEKRFSRPRKKL